jgi:hypothetical protein
MVDSATLWYLKKLANVVKVVITITLPTWITKKSVTLIDAIVTNKKAYECSSAVLDLGDTDHLA